METFLLFLSIKLDEAAFSTFKVVVFTMLSSEKVCFFADPRVRDSSQAVGETLRRFVENAQTSSFDITVGRSIDISHKAGHEVYFMIDISQSISNDDLKVMIEFCVRLIMRVSFLTILTKLFHL